MDKTIIRKTSYLLFIALVFVLIFLSYTSLAYADSASWDSDILVDLSHDENFTYDDYPMNNSDYSLSVIQIAESSDDELLVYVYQPCSAKDFRASSINISITRDENGVYTDYLNYHLTFCNSFGTLYKYKVDNFVVSTDEVRYYSIPQIMRPFDALIDNAAGYDNTISEVPYRVAKEWAFKYESGNLVVDSLNTEVVEITSKYVGYIHYKNGGIFPWGSYNVATDSHFVAFDTNRNIDELYEAEIQWKESTWSYEIIGSIVIDKPENRAAEEFGAPEVKPVKTLYYSNSHSQTSHRIFADDYSFNEIQTVDDLLAEEDDVQVWLNTGFFKITESTSFSRQAKQALKSQKWVLRFCETGYSTKTINNPPVTETIINRTRVSDVIILRLSFKSRGQFYNLGVVDNKQTGSLDPAAETKFRFEVSDLLKSILILLALLLLLYLLGLISPILKVIFAIISFPFKVIAKLIRGVKSKKEKRAENERNEKIDGLIEAVDKKNNYRYRRR